MSAITKQDNRQPSEKGDKPALDRNAVMNLAELYLGTDAACVFQYLPETTAEDGWKKGVVFAAIANAAQASKATRKQRAEEVILAHNNGSLLGIEIKHESEDRWVFILGDASERGRYRGQFFDSRGFYGHWTRSTPQEVLEEVLDDGFSIPAPGILEQLSKTQEWLEGMKSLEVVAQWNRRQAQARPTSHRQTDGQSRPERSEDRAVMGRQEC